MRRICQIVLVCFLTIGAGDAWGATATTTWTTYLYQGPGYRYAVVDEVPQATSLKDPQCSAGWCKVTLENRSGYLLGEVVAFDDPAQSAPGLLSQPAASLTSNRLNGSCVEANQTGGNGGNAMTIFCRR